MIPKFRAWDEEHNEMIRVISINFDEKFIRGLTEVESNLDIESSYNFEDIELLQFTGLKDKNGADIFYDDIVKVSYKEHSYVSYIIYEFHETTIEGEYIPKDFHYYENPLYVIFDDDYNEHNIEVIGNIYEHPHLLKE